MTKVEYIQQGFCTDKYFLLLKYFPSARVLYSVAISIWKHEVKFYPCTYVEIFLSQVGEDAWEGAHTSKSKFLELHDIVVFN